MLSGLFYHYFLDQSVSNSRVPGQFLFVIIIIMFYRNLVFNANSEDPDQMPHSVAPDLDLHCMLNTLLGFPY